MERHRECQHLEARRAIGLWLVVAETPGRLDESVVRLRAGVREEHLARDLHVVRVHLLGQLRLLRDLIEIRAMQQRARLLADRLGQPRVAVAERAHGDAGAEIEVTFPLLVPDAGTLATRDREGKAAVRRQDMLLEKGGGAHGKGAEPSADAAPRKAGICGLEVVGNSRSGRPFHGSNSSVSRAVR